MSADILAPAALTALDLRSLRAHALLELVANRYSGVDLVAARAELDRRLAAAGTGAAARYPMADESLPAMERNDSNERTLRRARRDVTAKILAATE